MIFFKPFTARKYVSGQVVHYVYGPDRITLIIFKRRQSKCKLKAPFAKFAASFLLVIIQLAHAITDHVPVESLVAAIINTSAIYRVCSASCIMDSAQRWVMACFHTAIYFLQLIIYRLPS